MLDENVRAVRVAASVACCVRVGGNLPALTRNGVADWCVQDPKDTFWAHRIHVSNDRSLAAAAVCLDVFDSLFFRGSHVVLRRFREFDDLRNRLIQVMCDV